MNEALVAFQKLQEPHGLAVTCRGLARLALCRGQQRSARALVRDHLQIHLTHQDKRGVAEGLELLVAAWQSQGYTVECVRLLGAAAILRTAVGSPLPPIDQPGRQSCLSSLQTALGKESFDIVSEKDLC